MLSKKNSIFPLLLLVICLLFYGRTLGFQYVWDDPLIFLDKNSIMVDPLSWGLLTEPILAGTTYMRPLVVMSWFIEFRLFGQRPEISHAINLAIYVANVYLVYFLGRISNAGDCFQGKGHVGAFIGAAFYASHPALIESTAWVAGRFDLMATFFILLAVHIYMRRHVDDIWRGVLVSISMLSALMCKELGIVLPGIIFFVWMASRGSKAKKKGISLFFKENKLLLVFLLFTAVFYFGIRRNAMGGVYHATISLDYLGNAIRLMLPLEALKEYFLLTGIPFSRVSIFHPLSLINPYSTEAIIGNIFTLFCVLLVGWFALVRRESWACWLMAGFCCLMPVIHLLPISIGDNVVQDRFMTSYLAFVAVGLASVPWSKIVHGANIDHRVVKFSVLAITFVWFSLSFFTLWTVVPLWKNELTLWSWTHKMHPDIEAVRYNYMGAALSFDRPELAEEEIKRLQDKNGGLEVGEQALYGNLLNRSGSHEGLKYLEGVIYALPKFHQMNTPMNEVDKFLLSSTQIAAVYMDYAAGVLAYLGDADSALKYNKISAWYLPNSQNMPLMYQRVAIYYAAGRYTEADDLIKNLDGVYHYSKKRQQRGVNQLLNIFCKNFSERKEICDELVQRGIVGLDAGS